MKKLIPIFLLFAACAPSRYLECPQAKTIGGNQLSISVCYNPDSLPPCKHDLPNCICLLAAPVAKPDTIPEWMHVSATRAKGFVIARKALSVRVNGYCVTHLDCDKRPFPVHYHVGWCQGKDELLTALLNERRAKQ